MQIYTQIWKNTSKESIWEAWEIPRIQILKRIFCYVQWESLNITKQDYNLVVKLSQMTSIHAIWTKQSCADC